MTQMPPPPATTSDDDDKDERTSALVGTLSPENLRNLLVLFFRSESERAKRFEATLNMQRRTVETIAEMIVGAGSRAKTTEKTVGAGVLMVTMMIIMSTITVSIDGSA